MEHVARTRRRRRPVGPRAQLPAAGPARRQAHRGSRPRQAPLRRRHRRRSSTPLVRLDARGTVDRARGMRSFVVGTGGARLYRWFGPQHLDAVEARSALRHGVLELTLSPDRYAWRFLGFGMEPEGDVVAAGADIC